MDFKNSRILLVKHNKELESYQPAFSRLGFGVRPIDREEKKVVVEMVYRNSPADKAGLMLGDRVLAINGRAV